MIRAKFEEAVAAGNRDEVVRFTKLFGPAGLANEGNYVTTSVPILSLIVRVQGCPDIVHICVVRLPVMLKWTALGLARRLRVTR